MRKRTAEEEMWREREKESISRLGLERRERGRLGMETPLPSSLVAHVTLSHCCAYSQPLGPQSTVTDMIHEMGRDSTTSGSGAPEIPEECIGGVVVNEGPDFTIEVRKVPVPKIGQSS